MRAEELKAVFDQLKPLLKKYEKGCIRARMDFESRYELWSEKEVEAFGKKRNEVYFFRPDYTKQLCRFLFYAHIRRPRKNEKNNTSRFI